MSDGFLMLAQAPGGLTCFVVPRVLDDGTRNPFALQRLKDKLGNRSNASSEVELDGTWGCAARRGGPRRPDHHRHGRRDPARLRARLGRDDARSAGAGGAPRPSPRRPSAPLLVDQPLMRIVLADLALESEAATVLGMRLAHAVDDAASRDAPRGSRVAAGQVLGLQAHRADGRRGAGVPGRQRLRRGERPGPALPRGAAQLDLGGLGQRQRPRRPARRDPRARAVEALDKELAQARGLDRRLDAAMDRTLARSGRPPRPTRSTRSWAPGGSSRTSR